MIRIMHLIVGLGTGGAEVNLYRLVRGMDRTRFENIVVCMLPPGPVRELIEECGVSVVPLGLTKGFPNPMPLVHLARLIRKTQPHILQTWMYHADLLGAITARAVSGPPVIWNIRSSDSTSPRLINQTVAHLCSRISHSVPARIISCSNAGRDFHVKMGYPASRMQVIFNGYDTDYYRPDAGAARRLCDELGLPSTAKLVAMIARYHPLKDHATFLDAARIIANANSEVKFVLCGEGISWDNEELVNAIDRLNLRESVYLLGRRTDVNLIMAAARIVVSSSTSEGFPNVIAEAMSCGAVCVATDVGDSRHIIGDSGIVVPPRRPDELARGVLKVFGIFENDASLPDGRARIIAEFGVEKVIEQYQVLYQQVAEEHSRGKSSPS